MLGLKRKLFFIPKVLHIALKILKISFSIHKSQFFVIGTYADVAPENLVLPSDPLAQPRHQCFTAYTKV
jgi:hypothetical protein